MEESRAVGADRPVRFVKFIAVVENIQDTDAEFFASESQRVIARSLEIIFAFGLLDARPDKVHSNKLESRLRDHVKIARKACEVDVDAETVGYGRARQ